MDGRPCECNCGGTVTERYKWTDGRSKQQRGEFKRFLPGHQWHESRGRRWAEYVEKKEGELQGHKICGKCKEKKELKHFYPSSIGLFKRSYYCTACTREINKKWKEQNPDYGRCKNAEMYQRAKFKVFEHYGWICNCCGETEPMFLSIDHVNNDGGGRYRKDRGYVAYRNIINQGFPDTFQVMCWNCNTGKQRNGGTCPHKTKAMALAAAD